MPSARLLINNKVCERVWLSCFHSLWISYRDRIVLGHGDFSEIL